MNREQWLAERRKGIGGSDVSAILGVNEYTTPYQLWLDKTGKESNEVESEAMRRGKILEPAVVEFWRQDTGLEILPESANPYKMEYHPKHRFLFGSPDRVYLDAEGRKGTLECKTTILNVDREEMPQAWFCQVQWYMGIMGHQMAEVCWLGKYFKVDRVQYNFVPDFFEDLVARAIEFREKYILADIAPPVTDSEDIKKMFKKHLTGKVVQATPETMEAVAKLKAIKEEAKRIEKEQKQLEDQIKLILQDGEALKYNDQLLLTWKNNKDGVRFDEKTFAAAHPDLHQQFRKETLGARVFLVK